MIEIDWYANVGRCFPEPGTIKKVNCGVCGAQMKVRRNVLGPTSWAMTVVGMKRRHDSFTCPRISEDWHERIVHLKMYVYSAGMGWKIDYDKKKKAAAKEIKKLLKKYAAR
ncbi:MAG: hypothetical protein HYT03_01855 [Candidatus Harrisonbacteria bacterium]|nr:hypothetical protein [Candidatus Harrisonbacteria bacterium]